MFKVNYLKAHFVDYIKNFILFEIILLNNLIFLASNHG